MDILLGTCGDLGGPDQQLMVDSFSLKRPHKLSENGERVTHKPWPREPEGDVQTVKSATRGG